MPTHGPKSRPPAIAITGPGTNSRAEDPEKTT